MRPKRTGERHVFVGQEDAVAPNPQKRAAMVGWYDPGQLVRTGVEVAISTVFGREVDSRALEALAQPQNPPFVCCASKPGASAWVDYVADTGDGWNSTYAVAYWLAQSELRVATADGESHETTHAGQVLILGGDQVYPLASRAAYKQRLVAPYKSARESSVPPHPEVYAIPGNHDWYDNLVSFTRLFCSKDWFAGWQTRQKRSYFVLRLPYGWWLVGTDIQLGSDIDYDQLEYFKAVAAEMKPDDRIILCTAEPHWIYADIYRNTDPNYYNEKSLSFLESRSVFGDRIQIFLAGDLHHYRRHEGKDRRQKITAGGGGAFLHPTHGPDVSTLQQDLLEESPDARSTSSLLSTYVQKAAYPEPATSRRLCWRNLVFPFRNPNFGVLTAFLYLLVAWSVPGDIATKTNFRDAFGATVRNTLHSPGATILLLAICAGFIFFTDTHFRLFRYLGGGLHVLTHIAAIFFIGWGTSVVVPRYFPNHGSTTHLLIGAIMVWTAGWLIGSLVFGVYLLLSLNVFRRHSNEAFSALRIQDYKNFLRFRLDPDGGLVIFPIGVERVARKWKTSPGQDGPKYEPVGDFSEPCLIETPIAITPKDLRRPPRVDSGAP